MRSALRRSAVGLLPVVLVAGCLSIGRGPNGTSVAFALDRNQVVFTNAQIDGHPGRFVLATAMPKSVLGSRFVSAKGLSFTAPFHGVLGGVRPFRIDANILDLEGSMDGMIGSDVIGPVVTIDFRRHIASIARRAAPPTRDMKVYRYRGPIPSIPITIDGSERRAIVDTAMPDTLVIPEDWLPGRKAGRAQAHIGLAGEHFESLDVDAAPVRQARIGNRLLSRFLIVIDYGHHRVALWRERDD